MSECATLAPPHSRSRLRPSPAARVDHLSLKLVYYTLHSGQNGVIQPQTLQPDRIPKKKRRSYRSDELPSYVINPRPRTSSRVVSESSAVTLTLVSVAVRQFDNVQMSQLFALLRGRFSSNQMPTWPTRPQETCDPSPTGSQGVSRPAAGVKGHLRDTFSLTVFKTHSHTHDRL